MKHPLYCLVARTFGAWLRCQDDANPNVDWKIKHEERIVQLCKEHLPSGSGFDCGTEFDFDRSKVDRLVFVTQYHHMSGTGYYEGWSTHCVICVPSLQFGFDLRITGQDRDGFKEYANDVFQHALSEEHEEYAE